MAKNLVEMAEWKESNSGMMLTVVDGTSKYAWVVPLNGKTGEEVSIAFRHIMEDSKRTALSG